jgi:ribosomal protein L28
MPNIHKQTLSLNGSQRRVKVCTRCLRTHHKLSRS